MRDDSGNTYLYVGVEDWPRPPGSPPAFAMDADGRPYVSPSAPYGRMDADEPHPHRLQYEAAAQRIGIAAAVYTELRESGQHWCWQDGGHLVGEAEPYCEHTRMCVEHRRAYQAAYERAQLAEARKDQMSFSFFGGPA